MEFNERFATKWVSIIALGLFGSFGLLSCIEMSKEDFGGPQAVGGALMAIGVVAIVFAATVLFPAVSRRLQQRGQLNLWRFLTAVVFVAVLAAVSLYLVVFGWASASTYRGIALVSGLSSVGMIPMALLWWGLGKYAPNK